MKTFTLPEAQMLLPVLEALLRRAQVATARAERLESEMHLLNRRIFLAGGMRVDVAVAARRRAEREKAEAEAKACIGEIEEIGVRIQSLDRGMLDFPSVANGEKVLLCWRLGEPAILYWHREEEPLDSRRPVEGLFGADERERPN